MVYLKPLFDIQRVYIDGKSFHYEVYYRTGKSFTKVIDACFFTKIGAQETIDELIESEV